jgi:hypothetical protein
MATGPNTGTGIHRQRGAAYFGCGGGSQESELTAYRRPTPGCGVLGSPE